jgi:predicted alpha-1,2-mannosidase
MTLGTRWPHRAAIRWLDARPRQLMAAACSVLLGAVTLSGAAATATAATRAASAGPVTDPAAYVDPFIGTADQGDDFPGADVPFGMVQWSPDTRSRPAGGGYSYSDSSITGFSLTHLSGAGCAAEGDVPVLPTVGKVVPTATDSFSHSRERASAGYYQVALRGGIDVQLTATTRTGMAQLNFPATGHANLIFKLDDSQTGDSATSFKVVSDTSSDVEVQGSVASGGFCGLSNRYKVYFDMEFSAPFAAWGTYTASGLKPGADSAAAIQAAPAVAPQSVPTALRYHGALPGRKAAGPLRLLRGPEGAYLTFHASKKTPLLAKVGLSYVSAANAHANLAAENAGWDFAATKTAAAAAWNALLRKIQISGGTTAQRKVFYTALYHSLQYPSVFSDDNGQYRGMDGKVHTVDDGHSAFYTNISEWDIYRGQAQLEALIDPAAASDTAQSMLDDYAQTGRLPKWPLDNAETYEMAGDPADAVLADYYAFGATGFDTSAALADMIHQADTANHVRPGGLYLNRVGYLPVNGTYGCCHYYGPVSTSLEYDTDNFAISAFAGALGNTTDQREFQDRAEDWRSVLDPDSGMAQPRDKDGAFASDFTPTNGSPFVEGDSWIYTGMVPFDVSGLASAKGGGKAMAAYLNTVLSSITGGADGYAYLGNEPSIELPWEYDYIGEPAKTQQTVRRIDDQLWTDTPGGTGDGNDDLGAMSAWYVWSALGMYPMTPGTSELALGSPLFPAAVITLASGAKLTVDGDGAAADAPYVRSAAWDGGGWYDAYAPAKALTSGGTLTFRLSGKPAAWASKSYEAPRSYGGDVVAPPDPRTGLVRSGLVRSLCLDGRHVSNPGPEQVLVARCSDTGTQQWTLAPDGTVRALGMCLGTAPRDATGGTPAGLYGCNGTASQQWAAGPRGTLVNQWTHLCLYDPSSTARPGAGLQIWTCNGAAAERWSLPHAPARRAGVLTSGLSSRPCLDDKSGRTKNGNPVLASTCRKTSAESLVVEPDGTLRLLGSCLDVKDSDRSAGALVDLYRCNGTGAQQWEATTTSEMINTWSGLCLTDPSVSGGRQLRLETCAGTLGQVWTLRN